MSTFIASGGCECLKAGVRLKRRGRSTIDGETFPWAPEVTTLSGVTAAAGDTAFESADVDAGMVGWMIDAPGFFVPDTFITAVYGSVFETSTPCLVAMEDQDMDVGGWIVTEWLAPRTGWYDAAQPDNDHGFDGLINTSRSGEENYTEMEYEFILTGAQITTRIDGAWQQGSGEEALDPITLTDDAPTTGILSAPVPPDGADYSGTNLDAIQLSVAFLRDP